MPNYRPILLLTTSSKILEKLVYNRLSQHLYVNKIITSKQFGFQKNSNTETAIYMLNNILKTSDKWFPNLFGPPPPWFHIHTHSAPLPFQKENINALLFPLLFYI
jgi:hypothetical protein